MKFTQPQSISYLVSFALALTLSLTLSACGSSSPAAGTPGGTVPAVPVAATLSVDSATAISLSWTAVTGASYYQVWRGTTNASASASQQTSGSTQTTTTYTDSGLNAATLYYYWLKACNATGCSAFGPVAMATTDGAMGTPAAPAAPTLTVSGATSIDVSWMDVNAATYYQVFRGTADDSAAAAEQTSGTSQTSTSFSDTGLTVATAYYYWLKACNDVGCSAFSPSAMATTSTALTPPPEPTTAPTTTIEHDTQIMLSWSAVTNATYYQVFRGTADDSAMAAEQTSGTSQTSTNFIDTGLTAITQYYYWIKACNSDACSDFGPSSQMITTTNTGAGSPAPATTTDPDQPRVISNSALTLTWTVTAAIEYELWRSQTDTSASATRIARAITTGTYPDTGLAGGLTYYYWLKACNATGCSAFSASAMATTAPPPPPPATPAAPTLTVDSDTEITVSWTAVDDTKYYQVFRHTADDSAMAVERTSGESQASTTYDDSGLTPETTYYYWITACNTDDCSAFSPGAMATTDATPVVPDVPTAPVLVADNDVQISLSWMMVGDTDYYQVFRHTADDSAMATEITSDEAQTDTSFTDAGLTANTTYYYWIKACNEVDCSAFSASATAMTTNTQIPVPAIPDAAPTLMVASASEITLMWTVVAAVEYEVWRHTDSTADSSSRVASGLMVGTYADTGLDAGTTYHYWLKACNTGGCSAFSPNATDITYPAAPATPTLMFEESTAQITVSWMMVTGATYYQVFRHTADDSAMATEITLAENQTTTSFTDPDTNLGTNTPYYYWLKACNGSGCSDFSTPAATITTPPASPTTAPTLTVVNDTAITLSWDMVTDASGYQVWRHIVDNVATATELTPGPSGAALTYENTGLDANTEYFYWIAACNSFDCSAPGPVASATTAPGAPGAPALSRTDNPSEISLAWRASTDVAYYQVFRNSVNNSATATELTSGATQTSTTYDDTDLRINTAYYYWVKACNAANVCSAFGGGATTTTPPAIPATPTVERLGGALQLTLSWPAVAGAAYYQVWRNTSNFNGPDSGIIQLTSGITQTTTTHDSTVPATDIAYYYWVKACNSANVCSDFSENPLLMSASGEVISAPIPPTPVAGPALTANSFSEISLVWTVFSGASYEVWRNTTTDSATATRLTHQLDAGAYSDFSLVGGISYTYWLKACNLAGCSAFSPATTIATPSAPANLPATPTIAPTLTVDSHSQISLSWIGPSRATYYQIWRNTTNSTTDTTITEVSVKSSLITTAYTDTGLTGNTPYYYWVKACNGDGCSVFGPGAMATTDMNPPAPAAPAAPMAARERPHQISLSWAAVAGATYYRVFRSVIDGDGFTDRRLTSFVERGFGGFVELTDDTPLSATESLEILLRAEADYYYWVKACNAGGCSGFSPNAMVNTGAGSEQNFGTLSLNLRRDGPADSFEGSDSQISLQRDGVPDNTSFELWRSTGTDFSGATRILDPGFFKHTDTGLRAATTYTYWIRRCATTEMRGCAQNPNPGVSLTTTPSPLDTQPIATVDSDTQISLKWSGVPGADRYVLTRGIFRRDPLNELNVHQDSTSNFFTDTGLVAGTTYNYWVRACRAGANTCSDYSPVARVTAGDLAVSPSAPTVAPALTIGNDGIAAVVWTAVDNATYYQIWRNTTNDNTTATELTLDLLWTATDYSDTVPSGNATYYYWIKACNGAGCSAFSPSAVARIPATPAAAPVLTADSYAAISLAWTAVDDATYYQVWRNSSSNNATATELTSDTSQITTTYTDTGLTSNTIYHYWIKACNGIGCSAFSPGAMESTAVAPPPPAAPVAPALVADNATQISLSWSAVTDASYYQVFRHSADNSAMATELTSAESWTALSYTDTGLSVNTSYNYWVKACNTSGCSAFSPTAMVSTTDDTSSPPPTPAADDRIMTPHDDFDLRIQSVPGSDSKISLTWKTITGVVSYEIWRSTGTDSAGAARIASGLEPDAAPRMDPDTGNMIETYTDNTGISSAATYYYWLKACNAGGCSDFGPVSDPQTSTPPPLTVAPTLVPGDIDPQITLSWPEVAGAARYVINRSISDVMPADGLIAGSVLLESLTNSYTDTGLEPDTNYYYRVRPCRAVTQTCSDFSPSATVTTGPTPPAPGPPAAAPTVTSITETTISLSWDAVEDATYYQVLIDDFGTNVELTSDMGQTTTSFTHSGLGAGNIFTYHVRACNTGGCSVSSHTVTAVVPNTPSDGFSFGLSVVSDTEIRVQNFGVFLAAYYEIFRGTTSENLQQIAEVTDDSPYADTGLMPATAYYYGIKACNSLGCTAPSSSMSVITMSASSAPATPTVAPVPTVINENQISLSWDAVDSATYYQVFRHSADDSAMATELTSGESQTTTTYASTGLAQDTAYYYWIKACNSANPACSDFSPVATATTALTPPGQPGLSNPVDTAITPTSISLLWNIFAIGTHYQVFRHTSDDSAVATEVSLGTSVTTSAYTDTGLTGGTTYYYWVKDCNAGGCSSFSPVASFTTSPSAPSAPALTVEGTDQVSLSWVTVAGATYYQVFRHTADDSAMATEITSGEDQINGVYIDTGLTANTAYYYWVKVCNASGCSDFSASATASTEATPAIPATPAAPNLTVDNDEQISLSWATVADASYYQVFRHSADTSAAATELTTAESQTTTSFTDAGLTAGTAYYYWIKACNSADCSGFSPDGTTATTSNAGATSAAPPAPDAAPVLTVNSSVEISLTWTAIDGLSYEVWRDTDTAAAGANLVSSGLMARTYTNTGLDTGTTYTYWIKACNSFACSALSTGATASTVPSVPVALSLASTSDTSLSLGWAVAIGATYYQVFRHSADDSAMATEVTSDEDQTTNGYENTGLTANTAYYYWVKACNSGGCSDFSASVTARTQAAPTTAPVAAPTITGSNADNAIQITLSWAAVATATYYEVWRSDPEVNASSNTNNNSAMASERTSTTDRTTATTFTDFSGLSPESDYFYWLKACNAIGCSPFSANLTDPIVTTDVDDSDGVRPASVPTPTLVGAADAASLTWTTGIEISYEVWRDDDDNSEGAVRVVSDLSSGSYIDTGLEHNTTYTYWLKACDMSGCTDFSTAVEFTTGTVSPVAVLTTHNAITLNWPAVDGADYYQVFSSNIDDSSLATEKTSGNAQKTTTFTNTDLPSARIFYYWLKSCDDNDTGDDASDDVCSDFSASVRANTKATNFANIVPDISLFSFYIRQDHATQANLFWTGPTDNVSYYEVWRNTADNSAMATKLTSDKTQTTTTYANAGLTENTTYYYWIKACNVVGCSNFSRRVQVSAGFAGFTLANPPKPGTGTISDGTIPLTWSAAGNASYEVWRDDDDNSEGAVRVASGLDTGFYNDTGLDPNIGYYYWLKACNVLGCTGFGERADRTSFTPSAPNASSTINASGDSIRVSWSASTGTTYYQLFRHTTDNSAMAIEIDLGSSPTRISYPDIALATNTRYYYWVKACNNTGCSDFGLPTTVASGALVIPPAPVAVVDSTSSISLTWTAITNATYYQVFRFHTTTSHRATELTSGRSQTTTSYTDTGLDANTRYHYWVKACNGGGCSDFSPGVAITTTTPPPPLVAPMSPPVLSVLSGSEISVTWTAITSAAYYEVWRSGTDATTTATKVSLDATQTTTSYTDTGLNANTVYYYWLRACDTSGDCSAFSPGISTISGLATPATAPTLAIVSDSQISVMWAALSDAIYYEVWRNTTDDSSDSGAITKLTSGIEQTTTTYISVALDGDTTYYYWYKACNAGGCSDFSRSSSMATTSLSAPAAFVLTSATATSVSLSWNVVSGATYYEVWRGDMDAIDSVGNRKISTDAAQTATSYTDSSATASTTYFYRAKACNTGGCSDFSSSLRVTTIPSAPASITAAQEGSSQISLSWSAVAGATYYEVLRGITQEINLASKISSDAIQTANSYVDTGLSRSNNYHYFVRACNDIGCSAPRATFIATSSAAAGVPANPPAAPALMVVSDSEITVTWTAVAGTVYEVWRGIGTASARAVRLTADTTGESHADTGLDSGTTYTYALKECDNRGCSSLSDPVTATTEPSVPMPPTATVDNDTQISLSWPAVTGASYYQVFRHTANDSAMATALSSGTSQTTTSYTDAGLDAGTAYYYWIKGCNASDACSAFSPSVTATTTNTGQGAVRSAPAVAPSLRVNGASGISLALPIISNATIEIWRSQSSDSAFATRVAKDLTAAMYDDTDLDSDTTYTYWLKACNGAGCSAFSASATATTDLATPLTPVVVITRLANVEVSWEDVGDSITYYQVWRNESDNPLTAILLTPGRTQNAALFYVDKQFEASVEYSYWIKACNDRGCSAFSPATSIATPDSLSIALDSTFRYRQSNSQSSSANWATQTIMAIDRVDALESGDIEAGESSCFETNASGPGLFAFHWNIDSERDVGILSFSIDGDVQDSITGQQIFWRQVSYRLVGSQSRLLQWCYYKPENSTVSDGGEVSDDDPLDKAFVDLVRFFPTRVVVDYGVVRFSWDSAGQVDYYRLQESNDLGSSYETVAGAGMISASVLSYDLPVSTHILNWADVTYRIQECTEVDDGDDLCADVVTELLVLADSIPAISYFKASNPDAGDQFGGVVAISGDGNTMAVSANSEDSAVLGGVSNQDDNQAADSGAVYVFTREDKSSPWTQQAFLKASNAGSDDGFGYSLAFNDSGNTLAIGADQEDGSSTSTAAAPNNSAENSGAVYIFLRAAGGWRQAAYLKASDAQADAAFGISVALNGSGDTLAVGANGAGPLEGFAFLGVTTDLPSFQGAAYVFTLTGNDWSQETTTSLKASTPESFDSFGASVSLSKDGNSLAVGAPGDEEGDNKQLSFEGAVYVFTRTNSIWSAPVRLSSTETDENDSFGISVSLNDDGDTLLVGAPGESSDDGIYYALGVDSEGDQILTDEECSLDQAGKPIGNCRTNNSAPSAGAAYIFTLSGSTWSQQQYLKAVHVNRLDSFGGSVSLSGDGNTMVAGAVDVQSLRRGIVDRRDLSGRNVGAAYVFTQIEEGVWGNATIVKAPNPDSFDRFGGSVSLSTNGDTLVVGASNEQGSGSGINDEADQENNDAEPGKGPGAAYVY